MKSIKIIAMLIGFGVIIHHPLRGQDNQSTTTSLGGGGGNTVGTTGILNGVQLQHFGVAGDVIVASPLNGGIVESHVGFLYAVDEDLANVACPVPDGLEVTALSDQSATISWNLTVGTNYQYRLRESGSTIFLFEDEPVSGTNIDLSGLNNGTLYEFELRADCDTDGVSEYSEIITFETFGPAPCEEPVNINLTVDGQTVSVNWNDPTSAPPTYVVEYRLDDISANWISTNVVISDNTASVSGLDIGTPYQLRVGSECSVDLTLFGSTLLFTTDGPPPCDVPTALTASNITTNSFQVDWDGAGLTYDARIRPQGEFIWTEELGISGTSQLFENLSDGVPYEVQVKANCAGSVSTYSDILTVTTEGEPCAIPADVGLIGPALETSALIGWTHPGALFFDVRYKIAGTANWITTQVLGSSMELSNLIGGLEYTIQVSALCTFDEPASLFSEPFNFLTAPSITPCDVPTDLQSSVVDQQATLTWNETNGTAAAFEVRYRQINAISWIPRIQLTNSLDLVELTPGATYEFQVRSLCGPTGEIQSEFSQPAEFEIPASFQCVIPENIIATPLPVMVTASTDITWNNLSEASGYIVRYRIAGTALWSSKVVANPGELELLVSTNIDGLEEGTEYQYGISTLCSADGSVRSDFSITATFITDGTICETPGNIGVVASETTAEVSWDNTGADSYTFRYRSEGTIFWITLDNLSNMETVAGLQGGVTYEYQVSSTCGNTTTAFSTVNQFTTTGELNCDAPVILAASDVTQNALVLSWNGPPEAESYLIQVRPQGSFIWNNITNVTGSFFNINGLFSGTSYEFRVQSICNVEGTLTSEFSGVSTFSTLGDPSCDLPNDIQVFVPQVPVTSVDPVIISWIDVSDAQFYQIRYRLNGTSTWSAILSNGVDDQVELSQLNDGATYEYQLRAVCEQTPFFASEYSIIQEFSTPGIPCTAPENIVVTVTGDNTANLVWDEVSSASDGYEYRYRPQGAVNWTIASTASGSGNNSAALNDLFAGTTYQFRVRSNCGDGVNSELSGIVTFTTTGEFICDTPIALGVIDSDASTVSLTWSGDDASNYDIQYRSSGSFEWVTLTDVSDQDAGTTGVQYTVTDLAADDVYDWRVRRICSPDRSIRSDLSVINQFATTSIGSIAVQREGAVNEEDEDEISISNSSNTSENDQGIVESLQLFELTAYPNPFTERLQIRLFNDYDAVINVGVYDLSGVRIAEIYEGAIHANYSNEFEFDGTYYSPGMYLLVITGLEKTISERIVIQR